MSAKDDAEYVVDTIQRLRADIERHIGIASELATDNERLRAIRDELVAALEWIAAVAPGIRQNIARAAIKKAKEQP
jgi:hypothetical protein